MHDFYITPEDYQKAKMNGISKHTLEQRIRRYGWRKEKAISEPVKKQNDRREWARIAESNGIKYNTFLTRISKMGWSEEKAATTPTLTKGETMKRMNRGRWKTS